MSAAAPPRAVPEPVELPAPAPETPAARTSPVGSAAPDVPPDVVLEVRDLRTFFFTYEGVVRALDGVSFVLRRGETTGLVGETGCGKSVTAFSVARLVPDPPGRVFGGQITLNGANLLKGLEGEARYRTIPGTDRIRVARRFRRIKRNNERMEAVRGRHIAMIFQEPTQALNPVFSIANQVGELLLLHHGVEILDEMLRATPDAPGVGPAIDTLVTASRGGDAAAIRSAADALGVAAGSSTLATEAFYAARTPGPGEALRRQLQQAVRRRRIGGVERRYLLHRQRLVALRTRANDLRLEELRRPDEGSTPHARAMAALAREGLAHFYYGLWGLRGRLKGPLDRELFWRVVRTLEGVRIANPAQVARGYPHELSGGMLQRVMIAMALSGDPDVLLADEPTTALDVTIQAQILDLLDRLRKRVGTAILLITHDLAVVAEVCDRVCVMYAGQIVEQAPVRELFRSPLHPYTQGLLASVPRLDRPDRSLYTIPGSVPDLIRPPSGCRFHPRCPHAMPVCAQSRPPVTVEGPEHTVACFLYHGAPVGS
jgi:peptide/nickel transport system ATP-binding protein